ncbi:hypothetical protein [Nocardioides sp.]|uniref:hypothetical protein n=1 Tax=Nocardioides sp. TaxID=35761 RepID=UPI003516C095
MSAVGAQSQSEREAPRRVREQARDAAVLMAFSLVVSIGCALALLLAPRIGR